MNRTTAATTLVYCVDLAKDKFQVHEYHRGQRGRRRTFNRARFDAFFADPKCPRGVVAMEACATSHYWSRTLTGRGFEVVLLPAQYVSRQRMGNKTDGNDADAIYVAYTDPRVKPVPPKSPDQQAVGALHKARDLLVKQRTMSTNQVRGLLAEHGLVAAKGDASLRALLDRVLDPDGAQRPMLPGVLVGLVRQLQQHLSELDAHLRTLQLQLETLAETEAGARRLDAVPGVGPIIATAVWAEYGDNLARFADSRQFAASLGLTPREHSSGQTRKLGGITGRGNPYLRRLLVQGAQAVITQARRRSDPIHQLAQRLLAAGKKRQVVAVAVANRLARILYALMRHQADYATAR